MIGRDHSGETHRSFLRKISIFSHLSDSEMDSVARMFRERRYGRNEIIFSEEETGRYMYIINRGRVKVSRILANGRETILAFHEAGEYFGEMSLIDGETAPATVTALVPTVILFIDSRDFVRLLDNPQVNRALCKMLSKRCRDAWAQISVLTFHHADARIRATLYQLCKERGKETEKGVRINFHLTHRDLAEVAGISRETATRVLGQLQDQQLIALDQRCLLVSDPQRLVEPLRSNRADEPVRTGLKSLLP